MMKGSSAGKPVAQLSTLLPVMAPFHRRYMVSNKILRLWANRVSGLKISMIVPQHGAPLVGAAVGDFIDWARELQCGIDLMGQAHYTVPG